MANQPIPVAKATARMQEYVSYMSGLGVTMSQQTQTISFDAAILAQWLNDVLPNTDELRVCLTVYEPGETHAGRISVALWPYKNGQPATEIDRGVAVEIEPFNEGQGEP